MEATSQLPKALNYIAIAFLALATYAVADGTLNCGNNASWLALCKGSRYNCSCDSVKQVSCENPPDFFCNVNCHCV
ncbi:hypothetical protein B0H63DRAFT_527102 [Podospora didyma]|uniref:Extracellular membrane protein CFEM domain-containing protein n=1 Tax=Podospora didyma TaxID=330526 RepID=A0AAE0K9W6_9PEZI|nr:hypothetical protein B0H63DRAFT_527102 [Podospora didyma]